MVKQGSNESHQLSSHYIGSWWYLESSSKCQIIPFKLPEIKIVKFVKFAKLSIQVFVPLHPWLEFEQSSSPRKTSWTFTPLFQHNFVSHTLSREILGSEALWPWLLASSGLSALVQLVTLPFFPDSPSYLLIQKGNEEACRKGRVSTFLTYFTSFDMLEWQPLSKTRKQGRAVQHSAVPQSNSRGNSK